MGWPQVVALLFVPEVAGHLFGVGSDVQGGVNAEPAAGVAVSRMSMPLPIDVLAVHVAVQVPLLSTLPFCLRASQRTDPPPDPANVMVRLCAAA